MPVSSACQPARWSYPRASVAFFCGGTLFACYQGPPSATHFGGTEGMVGATEGATETAFSTSETSPTSSTSGASETGGKLQVVPDGLPRVVFSEIMYHPVLDEGDVERHEFVELWNASGEEVSLAGWSVSGGIRYTFADDARLGPGAYVVLAKDPDALASLEAYGLEREALHGPYEGALSNGGDELSLVDGSGAVRDLVQYDDEAPWPISADALGASKAWLDAEVLPLDTHRYLGRSLERVHAYVASAFVSNWVASPLDGATPGAPNAIASDPTRAQSPVVLGWSVRDASDGAGEPVAGAPLWVQVVFDPRNDVTNPKIEVFADVLEQADEPRVRLPLLDDGVAPDATAGDRRFVATLPAQAEDTLLRLRVRSEVAGEDVVLSPRPDDPLDWHGVFVAASPDAGERMRIFIEPADWTAMWDYVSAGEVSGCTRNPTWNTEVPATLTHGSRVYDVRVRYQGSRFNRTKGPDVSPWAYPAPTRPDPVRSLSWHVEFPRYAKIDGYSAFSLNKLTQGCPGFSARVGFALFSEVGLATPETRYTELWVNGGYLSYTLLIERPGDGMLERYHEAQAPAGSEPEGVGHLFKSVGDPNDTGPIGYGDARPLSDFCGHTARVRYETTYERKTHEWATHDALIAMIDGLEQARTAGGAQLRDYLAATFDVDLVLNYIAVMNWSVPFDDMFQNHYLYQRRSDAKWVLFPWDMDQNFGGWKGAASSIYLGEQGDPDNRSGWWHRIKDSFFTAYRDEYHARMAMLIDTVLDPTHVESILDQTTQLADGARAAASAGGASCDFAAQEQAFRAFAVDRDAEVRSRLP